MKFSQSLMVTQKHPARTAMLANAGREPVTSPCLRDRPAVICWKIALNSACLAHGSGLQHELEAKEIEKEQLLRMCDELMKRLEHSGLSA